ncbi:MAG: hypothetical protein CSB15_00845 [Clostridiales bacterium]|nr:MAG: hypothetical protein CSB15_00845 [Clostridiales bacterium]
MNEEEISTEIQEIDNEVTHELEDTKKLQEISETIDIKNPNTIITYGQDTATEISKFADKVLHEMKNTKIEESSSLIIKLNDIMEEFDIKDFKEEKQGFLSKIFGSAKGTIEKIFNKYQTMGTKVDDVYQELKVYENQINQSNSVLEGMFESNMQYYQDLQFHIAAAKIYSENYKNNELKLLENKSLESGDQMDIVNYNNSKHAIEILDQRIYDLELAKHVSLQSLPQIKLIQRGNFDLIRKINSAFIVTLPIFKQGLTQAIALKRQKIQAEAMAELDKKTNELLLKNAENTVMQSKLTAELASGSGLHIETLKESWETIMRGIDETREIQAKSVQNRVDASKVLEQMQEEYKSKLK